jgi:hypothetical protein
VFRVQDYPLTHYPEQLRAEYRRAGQDVEFLSFCYNADFVGTTVLNASSSVNVPTTTDDDGDFYILATMQATFTTAGAFFASPNITCRITLDVSGDRLEDKDTALINIFGRGQRPFWWIRPRRVPRKSSFSTTLNNQDAVNNFNVRLAYWGMKAIPTVFR